MIVGVPEKENTGPEEVISDQKNETQIEKNEETRG